MSEKTESKKRGSVVSTLVITVVVSAICSLATYQITKNSVGGVKPNIRGIWYSSYAGQVFSLDLSKKDDTCKFGYEGQEMTECTYEYSDEVLKLKSSAGTDNLVYELKDKVLYISSQPYYNSKEESDKNDAYYFVPEDYDISMFTSITADEFTKKFNNGDAMFVLSARGSCGYCQQFRYIAAESVEKYNYTLYYLDSAKVTEEQYAAIQKLDKKFEETYGSTPNVYYVKGKKVVAVSEGAVDAETYGKFLEQHGVKKK